MMRVIEKLVYRHSCNLGTNFSTLQRLPAHLERLRNTTQCPYCGSALNETRSEWDDFNEANDVHDECRSCCWWRHKVIPNHYFIGDTRIGTLTQAKRSGLPTDVRAAIEEINRIPERLYELDPARFERLVGQVLSALYDSPVIYTGRTHDGGVDLVLLETGGGHVPVQVKRRARGARVEGVSLIREFRGALLLKGWDKGIVVSTADHFSLFAEDAARPRPEHLVPQAVDLIDARRLLDILGVIGTTRA